MDREDEVSAAAAQELLPYLERLNNPSAHSCRLYAEHDADRSRCIGYNVRWEETRRVDVGQNVAHETRRPARDAIPDLLHELRGDGEEEVAVRRKEDQCHKLPGKFIRVSVSYDS